MAGATALVMALGAQGRAWIGGTLIQVRDPWRPFIVAVVAAVLRMLAGRGVPLLGRRMAGGMRERLERERERFARPQGLTSTAKYYAAAAALVSIVWLMPHVLHMRRVPDPEDPVFSAWRIARIAHQLTHDPAHLFDGNIFYPAPLTLTYSDATVLQGIVATPFIVAGVDPLIVSNALFLSAFPLCALAFFYAGWRLTSDPRAALIAGVLGALYPFHMEHYSHLELQFFCFVPLAAIGLLRMLAAPGWKTGAAFGVAVALQWLASMYFGVMLALFLAPFAVFAIAGWRVPFTRHLAAAAAVAALPIVLAVGFVATPYLRSQGTRGDRPISIVDSYSAYPADYGRPHHRFAAYQWIRRDANKPERALWPGVTPLVLAAIGAAPPIGLPAAATLAASSLVFDGSLGTHGLIYDYLYRWVLPFRGMRVPARFSALVGTGLILLSAYGARRVIRLVPNRTGQSIIFLAVSAAVLFDLRPVLHLEDYPPVIPPIYVAVTPSMVLAEFPMRPDANIRYMYFSTRHWARMLNGYSGYLPEVYMALQGDLEGFPGGDTLPRLRREGVTHVTVHCALVDEPAACPALLASVDASRDLRLVAAGRWQKAEVRLYALSR